MSARHTQVGGDHYRRMAIQPWQIIEANGLDFWEGTALSYLLRWKDKGGTQDLEKAIHTLQERIEVEKRRLSTVRRVETKRT